MTTKKEEYKLKSKILESTAKKTPLEILVHVLDDTSVLPGIVSQVFLQKNSDAFKLMSDAYGLETEIGFVQRKNNKKPRSVRVKLS